MSHWWHATVSITLITLSVIIFTVTHFSPAWKAEAADEFTRTYSYRGRDYPDTWPLPPLGTTLLFHEDSVHYDLDTDLGLAEWNATLPSGGTLLHLGRAFRPFTLSMFHQLRCLDIIRGVLVELYRDESESTRPAASGQLLARAGHCMNYLRQTVMCRADLRLESLRASSGPQMTVSDVRHTCKDWTAVYRAAEENYREFVVGTGRR